MYTQAVMAACVGANIGVVLDRYGIRQTELARAMEPPRSQQTVSQLVGRDNIGADLLTDVADAINRILERRRIPARYSASSLLAGSEPAGPDPPTQLGLESAEMPRPHRAGVPGADSAPGVVEALLRELQAHGLDVRRATDDPADAPGEPADRGWFLMVPLYDGASCGLFDPTQPEPDVRHVLLPRHAAGPGATEQNTILVIARGDSMILSNIHDGDELTVRLDLQPAEGGIVVARCNGGVAVRRLLGGYLVSEGLDGRPYQVKPVDGDAIVGVVVYVGHRTA